MCKKPLFTLVIIVAATACSTTPRYYKTVKTNPESAPQGSVGVSLYISTPQSASTPDVTALQLSEAAQVAYIGKAGDNISAIQTALAAPFTRRGSLPALDRSSVMFTRTMNFTITSKNLQPADRLYSADIIATIDDGWRFDESRNFQDQNREIRVAQVMRSQALEFGSEAGISIPGASTLGLNGSNNATIEVNQNLDFEVVPYAPTLSDKEATFYLEAQFPQISVAGTYAVTVSIEAHPDYIKTVPVFRFNTTSGSESVTKYDWQVFKAATDPVTVNVKMPYRMRHVLKNAHTIEERDDTITWVYGDLESPEGANGKLVQVATNTVPSAVSHPIIDKADIREDIFIAQLVHSDPANKPSLVKLYDPSRHPGADAAQCIGSENAQELRSFLNWVNERPGDRVAFVRDNRVLYRIVDANNPTQDVVIKDGYQLRVTPFPLNYPGSDYSNKLPRGDKGCTNLL